MWRPVKRRPEREGLTDLTPSQLEMTVRDDLMLATVGGAVPALLDEVQGSPGAVFDIEYASRDNIVAAYAGTLRGILPLRLASWCAIVLLDEVTTDLDSAFASLVARIASSSRQGVLSVLHSTGPQLRFRVDPIGQGRWDLRDRLIHELGWVNDPTAWDINITHHDGRLVAQIGALYRPRRLGKLARIPASTNPVVAAFMARRLQLSSGDRVLDPFCGSGTLLLEVAALKRAGLVVGSDVSGRALRAAWANVARSDIWLVRADATALPFERASFTRVVSNLPFGKRVGSHARNVSLYRLFARELERILTPRGRAVLLTEEKRLFREAFRSTAVMRIANEVVLDVGGLHPSVFVVVKGSAK